VQGGMNFAAARVPPLEKFWGVFFGVLPFCVPHTVSFRCFPRHCEKFFYWCFLVPNKDRVPCSLR